MSVKQSFESQLAQQRTEIAKQAIKQAFRGGIPARVTMKEILAELQEDDALWSAFNGLTFQAFTDMVAPPTTGYGTPGPSRKRGVTAAHVIDYIRQNPGARRHEIMKALGLRGGAVSSQLRTLRMAGKLRGEGPERNFQYYAV